MRLVILVVLLSVVVIGATQAQAGFEIVLSETNKGFPDMAAIRWGTVGPVQWENDFLGHIDAHTWQTAVVISHGTELEFYRGDTWVQVGGVETGYTIEWVKLRDADGDSLDEVYVSCEQDVALVIKWVGPSADVGLDMSVGAIGSELRQNVPNPFNPETTIQYTVPTDAPVALTIYDVTGRRVRVLQNGHQAAGDYTVQWDGRNETGAEVASGSYCYQLVVDGQAQSRKMIVLK